MEHSSSDSSVNSIHDRDNDSETSCSATGELESGDEEAEDQSHLHPTSHFKDSLGSEDGSSRDSSPGPSIHRRVPSSPTLGSLHSRNVRHAPPHSYPDRHHDDPPAQVPQRSWYEFDLAVILAFVSPIGNLLTGGDHVKNLVFIIFLVYYLHQIIEVPWELYQKAQRRRRPPHLPPVPSGDKHRDLAISELRKIEIFCLALTAISPLIGVYLLRYATTTFLGPDSLSWFSTGLFVMATGMRPWSHLIDRLSNRTSDLQNLIHYPPSTDHYKHDADVQEKLKPLMKRIEELEDSLAHVKSQQLSSEDVFDYVNNAVDSVKRSIRKHEKQWDEQEGRVRSMEESIAALSSSESGPSSGKKSRPTMIPIFTTARSILPRWFLSPPPGSESDKDKSRYGSRRRAAKSAPYGSTAKGRLATIAEEDHYRNYPLLAKPSWFVTRVLHAIGYVVFTPLRAVVRMVSGRY